MSKQEKLLLEIKETLEKFQTVLGPVGPTQIPTLDGWSWRAEGITTRTLLNRGAGRVAIVPAIQGEKGWLNFIVAIFSDPETVFHFACDNWVFQASPFFWRYFSSQPNNTSMYLSIYNPATPYGPMYGLLWNPSQFWPYKTTLTIQAEHPATALTATSQIVMAGMGRHYIRDEKHWYETIFIEEGKQIRGTTQVPLERRPYHYG